MTEKPGDIVFRTTGPLAAHEGLTVAVAFPKGLVAEPSSGSRMLDWLADDGPPIVGGLGASASSLSTSSPIGGSGAIPAGNDRPAVFPSG